MTPGGAAVGGPARAPARGHLERLARHGTASVAGAACSAVFGVLLVVVVTNGFPASTAGTLFAATSVFLVLESVALLGTDTGLVKQLPAQLASGRGHEVPRTLAVAAAPVAATSIAAAVVLHASAEQLSPYLVGSASATAMTGMLHALAPLLPVAALHDLVVAATRGTGSMRPTVVVENIGRLGLQAVAVLGVLLAGGGPSALALAWALPYLLGLVAAAAWLRSLVGPRSAADPPAGGDDGGLRPVAVEFWSFTAPRAIARITQTALKRSDIVLVAALSSPAQAALYTAATRLIVVGQLFVQSVQQALSPHVSALLARGDRDAAGSVFRAATTWSVVAAWPFYLVLAGFSPVLMRVFGEGYDVASDVVVVLSLTMLLATACGPVDSVLLMAGRSWLSLRNSVVALAVNIGLNLVLIPSHGIRGAAVAWSVAIVVRNLLPLLQVRRDLGLWPVTGPTTRVMLLALACYGAADVVVLATGAGTLVGLVLLGVAVPVHAFGTWRLRRELGLEVFTSVLRRRAAVAAPRTAAAA